MNRTLARLLQAVTVIVGLGTVFLMLWEPHLEGRNAHATVFEIYFRDPFLAYVYLGSTPFFLGLYRSFRLAGHLGRTGNVSPETVDALRSIRNCALALLGFVVGGIAIVMVIGDKEDRPAGLVMGAILALGSCAAAAAAAGLARRLKTSLNLKQ